MGQLHDCSSLVSLPGSLLWNRGNTARRGFRVNVGDGAPWARTSSGMWTRRSRAGEEPGGGVGRCRGGDSFLSRGGLKDTQMTVSPMEVEGEQVSLGPARGEPGFPGRWTSPLCSPHPPALSTVMMVQTAAPSS